MNNSFSTKRLVIAGICLALAMVLPLLTAQIPQVGVLLSPMHIPVLLCGFVAGWPLGMLVGFIAPFLRFLLFGMPALIPMGTAMAFELAAYGLVSGLLYRALPRKMSSIYVALIAAMLAGRIVFGIAMYVLLLASGGMYTFGAFFTAAFANAIPGIVLHILIIPPIVSALQNAGLIPQKA